jgi:xanthine dehydrogenase accessory factor
MPLGSEGAVAHSLLEDKGERLGGFDGDDRAFKAMPEKRLLKPAQLLQVPGEEHPLLLEWLRPTGTVFIFGGGHVGRCVAHLAAYVDFKVVVIDDREEFASKESVPDADECLVVDTFDGVTARLGMLPDSYAVIVTRGHAHDRNVLEQCLKEKIAYLGMIGSRRKIKLQFQSLLEEGVPKEDLERVHAPIGLPIGGETPEEIAVSIVAEMLQTRNRKEMS